VFARLLNKSIERCLAAHLVTTVFCYTCSPASSVEREQQLDYYPINNPFIQNRACFNAFIRWLTLACCWHACCTFGGALEMLP